MISVSSHSGSDLDLLTPIDINRSQPDSSLANGACHMLDPKMEWAAYRASGVMDHSAFRRQLTFLFERTFFLRGDGLVAGHLGVSDGQSELCIVTSWLLAEVSQMSILTNLWQQPSLASPAEHRRYQTDVLSQVGGPSDKS